MEIRERIKKLLIRANNTEDVEQKLYLLQAADKLFFDNYLDEETIDEFIKESIIVLNKEDITEYLEAPIVASNIYMKAHDIESAMCVYNKRLDILLMSNYDTDDVSWFILPDISIGLICTVSDDETILELIKYEVE